MEFLALEPDSPNRADLRAAMIAAAVLNSQRTKGPAFKPEDFLPDTLKGESRRMTGEEIRDSLLSWTRAIEARQRQRG